MQMELDTYKTTVDKVNEEAKKMGGPTQDTGAICQICHKTKFADGIGHRCNYCQLRSCARCGGRMTVKTKVEFFNFFTLSKILFIYYLWIDVSIYCIMAAKP